MTNGKSNRKKLAKIAAGVIGVLVVLIWGISLFDSTPEMNDPIPPDVIVDQGATEGTETQAPTDEQKDTEDASETEVANAEEELMLYMIDVGQADSFLLVQNGKTALIDCGTQETGKDVVNYLKQLGIKRIDYLFGTHPHEDHMGGMYDVINNFEIGKIILPEVEDDKVTTNWYMKLMMAIKEIGYSVENATYGTTYQLGDASMKIIGPVVGPKGDDLNNYSTVLKVTFGEMDVVMTGDAEREVEDQILACGEDIDAEILKLGHHGSDTSTSDFFLDNVSPDYALISAGVGNRYKHPTKSTMEKLEENNVEVYRTDEDGTVIATITSDDVSFNCEPGDYLSGTELKERSTE